MSAPFATPSDRIRATSPGFLFPKDRRLLRSSDFRQVYQKGFRITGPLFAAFCLKRGDAGGPRIGFTVPRALGKAVIRNRIKRRMRECARLKLGPLPAGWAIVFNPRRPVLDASFDQLCREVERVLLRCSG
jgi:ribonuclease P protein component